jgi:hypothetical protein
LTVAFVAMAFAVLWLIRLAAERFGIGFDSDTAQLPARVFDRVLDLEANGNGAIENGS